jgi:O-antigen ligase
MISAQAEKTIVRLLAFGVPAVSMFLITSSVTDPVNSTKFLFLGGIGTAAWFLFATKVYKGVWKTSPTAVILSALFIVLSLNAVFSSSSPLVQNLYGVYGRNTGFFTYLFLSGIFLVALGVIQKESFRKIYLGLFVTGVVNVLYCGWVVFFGDFIGWTNPYGNILGLFGNPNFIGSFLGIWISGTFAYFVFSKIDLWKRVLIFALLLLALYEVQQSRAVQGVVVTTAGVATVLFYFIRSKGKGWYLLIGYSFLVLGFGVIALLGALQRGPLAEIVYKTSVSLRGAYWNAGIQTGLSNPFTGAGMDAYGDWYRRSRSESAATILPGPNTVTNSAHNVVLDMFAYGGFPLLASYLGIMILGAWAIIKNLRRTKVYDPIFVALSVSWIGYQLQSIISINQIGLVVWGWLLTGLLVAYEVRFAVKDADEVSNSFKSRPVKKATSEVISSQLVAGVGIVTGLILAAPPMSADMAWYKATSSANFLEVEKALTPSYLRPLDSSRLVNAVSIMESSQLFEQSLQYALKAVEFNPENFDSWYALYAVKNSTPEQKELALRNLKRLDPYNPDVIQR